MRMLVLGGTRSGKSAHAESVVAAAGTPVVYVATARVDRDDEEMAFLGHGILLRRPDGRAGPHDGRGHGRSPITFQCPGGSLLMMNRKAIWDRQISLA